MSGVWLVALLAGILSVPAFVSADEDAEPEEPPRNDTVEGTSGSDTITAVGAQTINAGDDGDSLTAGEDASGAILNGEAGNDTLTDGGRNVTLNGGIGNDLFNGGDAPGAVMNGGEGVDTFQLDGAGGVEVNAGLGDDVITTTIDSQNVVINGGGAEDRITLRGIGAVVHGDNGDDVIEVLGAATAVFGDAGNDTITVSQGERGGGTPISGGDGDDLIVLRDLEPALGAFSTEASGDAGDDRFDVEVVLGPGASSVADVLSGGTGADTFELSFVDEDNTSAGNLGIVSRITDFDPAEDVLIIDTSELGARVDTGEERQLDGFTISEDGGVTTITLEFVGASPGDAGTALIRLDGVTGLQAGDITFVS